MLGFCIKTQDWVVRWQSEACIKSCGSRIATVCSQNCPLWAKEESVTRKDCAVVFRFREIEGKRYDVVIIQSEGSIITILCPADRKLEESLKFFKDFGLTDREAEIMLLKLEGLSNPKIHSKLFISKATLKTHINNIRRKLIESGTSGNSRPLYFDPH